MLNGTVGQALDPKTLSKFYVSTFDPDACRSLHYSYHGDVDFEGVKGWKYVFSDDMLADPTKNEDNMCFCTKPGEKGESCYKRGVIDLAPCRNGKCLRGLF
jgi:hypothetical protein